MSIKDIGVLLIGMAACVIAVTYLNRPNSRFMLVQLGSVRADQFLLDKSTGRIWQSVCIGGSSDVTGIVCKGKTFWNEMFVSNITPEESPATSDFRDFINEYEKKHNR